MIRSIYGAFFVLGIICAIAAVVALFANSGLIFLFGLGTLVFMMISLNGEFGKQKQKH